MGMCMYVYIREHGYMLWIPFENLYVESMGMSWMP